MNSNLDELNEKVKKLKAELDQLILMKEDLNDPEVIKTSQMLDDVLNMLYNLKRKCPPL